MIGMTMKTWQRNAIEKAHRLSEEAREARRVSDEHPHDSILRTVARVAEKRARFADRDAAQAMEGYDE